MNWLERRVVTHMIKALLERIFVHWKTTTAGTALTAMVLAAVANSYQSGMTWKQWMLGAVPMVVGIILKDPGKAGAIGSAVLAVMLLGAVPATAQTAIPAPAPTTSSLNFSIGASAMGLGGASQATPASDVTLELNPGFSKFGSNFNLLSDNLLAPGPSMEYFGGGSHLCLFGDCPKPLAKLPGVFAPLSLHVGGTVGVVRFSPATGPTFSHVGFMLGGELKWTTSPGVQITLIRVDDCHFPGAPWGSNAPCVSGGISYLFGKH